MFKLVAPDASYYHSFAESHREWEGAHQDGAGLRADDDITSQEGFGAWVRRLTEAESAAGGSAGSMRPFGCGGRARPRSFNLR